MYEVDSLLLVPDIGTYTAVDMLVVVALAATAGIVVDMVDGVGSECEAANGNMHNDKYTDVVERSRMMRDRQVVGSRLALALPVHKLQKMR